MLSQRIKYTYQVISKYLAAHLKKNFITVVKLESIYYESTNIKSEFWRKRWSKT